MDVNLTISLMRGQMGAVIEKAVNVAVETVLGEMIRVVGLKFEDIKREMSAKEKENDTIRKMLESSRCEIKTMRKYMSLLDAKVSRDKLHQQGHRAAGVMVGVKAPRPGGGHLARTSLARHQVQAAYETLRCDNQSGEDAAGSSARKGENSCTHLVDSQGLLSNIPTDLSDPVWFQNPLDSAEPVPTDISGRLSPCIITDQSAASQSSGAPLLKVKQEDAEIQITCVKDEPSEDVSICSFEYSNPELDQSQVPLDLPRSLQGLQSPGASADLAFIVGESASSSRTVPDLDLMTHKPWPVRVIVSPAHIQKVVFRKKPATVDEFTEELKKQLNLQYDFTVHYNDPKCNVFRNLEEITQLPDRPDLTIVPLKSVQSSEQQPATAHDPWPSPFQVPQFSFLIECSLRQGNVKYLYDGTPMPVSHAMKRGILQKLAEELSQYMADPQDGQVTAVARALIAKHPCLAEDASVSRWHGWKNSLKWEIYHPSSVSTQDVSLNDNRRAWHRRTN